MIWIHESTITEETLSFLSSKLRSTLPIYIEQLSLNSNPHIIKLYEQTTLAGLFFGERDEQTKHIFELKLAAVESNVKINSDFWAEFKDSCMEHDFLGIVCYYLSKSTLFNIPIEEIERIFHCSDIIRFGLSYRDYGKIEKILRKTDLDHLSYNQKFEIVSNKKSKNFQVVRIRDVSLSEFEGLYKSYIESDTNRIVKQLIMHFPKYQTHYITRIFSGDFGIIDEDLSMAIKFEGSLAGYILTTIQKGKRAFVHDFNVHPRFQRLGLGKILIRNMLIKCFEEKKCEFVEGLIEDSHFMRKFYESLGGKINKIAKEGIWIF